MPHVDGAAEGRAPVAGAIVLEAPGEVPPGVPFPVLVQTADGSPADGVVSWRIAPGGGGSQRVNLYRGRGSFSTTLPFPGAFRIEVERGGEISSRPITVAARNPRPLRGSLPPGETVVGGQEEAIFEGTVVVPAGATLVVEAGARLLGGDGGRIDVAGRLDVRGAAAAPVLLSRAGVRPFGGIALLPGARATLRHLLITGGGGDETRVFGHSFSQPVVFAKEAELTVVGGGAVDNPGKAYSSEGGAVTLRDLIIARCDTGGEHNDPALTMERVHIVEIPDGDGVHSDDDNDGLYLNSGGQGIVATRPMLIRDSVIAVTEDDGIDHAGALLTVERTWIERTANEGIAASNGGTVAIRDSVFLRSAQGIEAGWGGPLVTVEHSLVQGMRIGLRWGDSYAEPANEGRLTARFVAVLDSAEAATRAFWEGGNVARPEALSATCSLLGASELVGQGGNVAGAAQVDARGCVSGVTLPPECGGAPVGPRCR